MKNLMPTSSPPFDLKEEDIQKCAYFLWQEEGCPSGRDLDLWLAAKELLRHHGALPGSVRRKNCAAMTKKRGAVTGRFR
jgi:hypothetical protein